MILHSIETFSVAVPLTKPFKTALRTVTIAESIFVKITTEDGSVGWGEAPPTHVITGDSLGSIQFAIDHVIGPQLIGLDLHHSERVFQKLHRSMVGNSSAKAALDMALHDLLGQLAGIPLVTLLGGYRDTLETDFTVSVNDAEEMAEDAARYVKKGFNVLKIKVGIDDIEKDVERIRAIREKIGYETKLRLDANQGWEAKEAVRAIGQMEDAGLEIELIEQPVKANDIEGLQHVTLNTHTPIMADESIFTPKDAIRVLQLRAADLINIKLMKAGGIYQALKINALAESYGVECMTGSMIETKLGISAAAHFAASQPNVTRFDFDAPLMLAEDIVEGGIVYDGRHIRFSRESGLGIHTDLMNKRFHRKG
ncbi:O-succinylbenzoate synthase [Paenisporosarcina sp. HGH0030]|uniref:mandelate racemase/muconate lactonizing enzyme family protein n=1 Tax=Paenisporosarcina sp. HGH0030 TaxID=1078085 RepID=UPI00034E1679|nr:dipeptide epimerase [Paenisporosarcina sp. HGH0030]EPD51057.1 O-succinylbenzoate synthase [Paenisporosarcina sp. HGH0030]